MDSSVLQSQLITLEKGILRTLLYFDIFDYPLTEDEIFRFAPVLHTQNLKDGLDKLVHKNLIYRFGEFYTLHDNAQLITRRVTGNNLAKRQLAIARKISKYASMFPFVRAVLLSGSISKGYMDEHSDIDYFIITAPGRLWIVRTAMVVFRRLFLFNSRKYFCTNYFIDSENLEIKEKNLFTATEIATLKPMCGEEYVRAFQNKNKWCNDFLPNHLPLNDLNERNPARLRPVLERLFLSRICDQLDVWLMKQSQLLWRRRYNHLLSAGDFSIAFESTRSVSRCHPGFYQKKVLSRLHHKTKEFEDHHSLNLSI